MSPTSVATGKFERRRSSIHLDPVSMRLPGSVDIYENFPEKLNVSDKSGGSSRSASTSDDSSPESPNPTNLAPVKPPSRLPPKNESHYRATSSDNTHNRRQRSPSLIAHLFEETTSGNTNSHRSRRPRRISVSDDFETTAQFIENIRQELMKQL